MKRLTVRRGLLVAVAAVTALGLVACGGTADTEDSPSPTATDTPSETETEEPGDEGPAPVTITIGNAPSPENVESFEAFQANVDSFLAANPHISVELVEGDWTAEWFQTGLAGGTLPTVYYLPFTEANSIVSQGQVLDITDYLPEFEVFAEINPAVLSNVTDDGGRVWAVPTSAYTMALLYNRDLFVQAGLDPDDPPQSWDEVRESAKAIDEATSAQGFGTWTSDNSGGWTLTAQTYSRGGTLLSEDASTATLNNPATVEALEWYQALRWEDDTFGSNFLVGWADGYREFGAGQVGMFVAPGDSWLHAVVNNGLDPQHFGLAPLPQDDDGLGTLLGGGLRVINKDATPDEARAGLAWVQHYWFNMYVDQEAALAQAKANNEAGDAVGTPGMRIVGQELEDQWLEWVADYINVPRENFPLFFATVDTLPTVPEPAVLAQNIYAELDTVVQAVLTDRNADIEALLTTAQNTIQAQLDAG